MKKLAGLIVSLAMMVFAVTPVLAAPNNATNNPNIVANYSDGSHTVIQPDGSIAYDQQGSDVVMLAGNSNNAQQFFQGGTGQQFFEGTNGGVHTVFKDVGQDTTCPDSWVFLGHAYPSWGTYFVPGDNYCAHSNSF